MSNINENKFNIQKPCLKWVGGKTQIMGDILSKIPKKINNYHELFLGGGSVLLAVLSYQQQEKIMIRKKIYASDSNKGLINVFKAIQHDPVKLYECITSYIHTYDSLTGTTINRKPTNIGEGLTSKESYYFWIRRRFNEIEIDTESVSIEHASLFLFINKTCFRGMYREGPNGFNVPYGHYQKTPKIVTQEDLLSISELIKNVIFTCQDFDKSLTIVKKGDFVYLDPPYAPETKTSFVKYNTAGFGMETHERLFHAIDVIHKKGVKFIMNNANVDIVTSHFQPYSISIIEAKRSIHAKNPGTTTSEVIITN